MPTRPAKERAKNRGAQSQLPSLSEAATPSTSRVPPIALRVGDRLVDETGEEEGIGRPYTTTGGKTANVRVKRVASDVTMSRIRRAERVNVKRAMAEEDKR